MIRVAALVALGGSLWAQMPNRWVFVSRGLGNDRDVEDIRAIAKTSAEHGLTGIMLSAGFDRLGLQNAAYRQRLAEVRRIADEHSLEIIPLFYSPGYASGFLAHNRNLAEGLPVKRALFVVAGNEARHTPELASGIRNSSFEERTGHRVTGYQLQDRPGELSFVDTDVYRSGGASLRFENLSTAVSGNARVMQEVAVQPHRSYRVTTWVRTDALQPSSTLRIQVLGMDGSALAPWSPNMPASADWRKLTFGFNSGDRNRVRIYAGTWGARSGKWWVDDLEIEEVALVNVLRRAGTPVTVESEDGAVYEEGIDFAAITDPLLNHRFDHDGPRIRLLSGTRIRDGERLRVSYFHSLSINDGQVTACMSEPEIYEISARNIVLLQELLAPRKWMLSIDEIRSGGTCDLCKRRGLTMGQILGDYIGSGIRMIREVNPEAEVFAWSDMLDPNHNAHGNYYMVDGDYTGSWENIPGDLQIVCWYYAKRQESLEHFSRLGFKTLAGAYYDGDDLSNPEGWLEALRATPGATGIMYTTWENKYGLLGAFGDLVSGRSTPSGHDRR